MCTICCLICHAQKYCLVKHAVLLRVIRTSRFVVIAMEALDTLLVTCHAHTLNLFVESFLKMVQKLLECNEPELQCLATSSVSTSL